MIGDSGDKYISMKQTRVNLGSFHRHHGDDNKKPKTHISNNANQHLQDKPSTSKQNKKASPAISKDRREEEEEEDGSDLNSNRKQTVITKVKEKAMNWRQTIAKKKHLEGCEDNEDHDCFETPMHMTGNAPTGQSQEEDPSPSRVPALGDNIKNPRSIRTSTNAHKREQYPPITFHHKVKGKSLTSKMGIVCSLEEEESVKTPNHSPLGNAAKEFDDTKHTKTLAEAVTEKLAPACNGAICEPSTLTKTLSSAQELYLSKPLTVTPSTSEDDGNLVDDDVAFGVYEERELDTSVSFTDHVKDGMEPEEDERALWDVIRNAILSPTMNIGNMGVMETVKEVVTSLLHEEEDDEEDGEQEDEKEQLEQQQQPPHTNRAMQNTRSSSPLIPISTNAYEGFPLLQERKKKARKGYFKPIKEKGLRHFDHPTSFREVYIESNINVHDMETVEMLDLNADLEVID